MQRPQQNRENRHSKTWDTDAEMPSRNHRSTERATAYMGPGGIPSFSSCRLHRLSSFKLILLTEEVRGQRPNQFEWKKVYLDVRNPQVRQRQPRAPRKIGLFGQQERSISPVPIEQYRRRVKPDAMRQIADRDQRGYIQAFFFHGFTHRAVTRMLRPNRRLEAIPSIPSNIFKVRGRLVLARIVDGTANK